jgi:hypothetical protein
MKCCCRGAPFSILARSMISESTFDPNFRPTGFVALAVLGCLFRFLPPIQWPASNCNTVFSDYYILLLFWPGILQPLDPVCYKVLRAEIASFFEMEFTSLFTSLFCFPILLPFFASLFFPPFFASLLCFPFLLPYYYFTSLLFDAILLQ